MRACVRACVLCVLCVRVCGVRVCVCVFVFPCAGACFRVPARISDRHAWFRAPERVFLRRGVFPIATRVSAGAHPCGRALPPAPEARSRVGPADSESSPISASSTQLKAVKSARPA